ncbi:hypothetical protein ABGB12_01050 [Actinocorallia sp. B10E7]|uniref:hypothetical protein n=1 Tax=Actinocorallia sp. B10E7 TaxID=3153558 RepID=UPI00325DDC01
MELPVSGVAGLDEAIASALGPLGELSGEDMEGPPADLAQAYVRGAAMQATAAERYSWYLRCDPLDVLFLGASPQLVFIDHAHRFGNERTRWLRSLRGTTTWTLVEEFAQAAVATAHEFRLPLDDIRLVLALTGRIGGYAWARPPLPDEHLPVLKGSGLDGYQMPTPPIDAAERSAMFWRSLEVELPCDGTVIDTLRAALHDLGYHPGRRGLGGLPATCLGVCLAHRLGLRDLDGEGHRWWLLGFPEGSPLHEPGRVLAISDRDGLDNATALAHLLGTPGFGEVFDPADARWHSAPGTDLPPLALELGEALAASSGKLWLPDGTVRTIDRAGLAQRISEVQDTINLHRADPGRTLPPNAVPKLPRQSYKEAFEQIGVSAAWSHAFDTTGLTPGFDGWFADPEAAARWQAAVTDHQTTHPHESCDPDADRRRLRRFMALGTLHLAKQTPEFGASLLSRLTASGDDLIAGLRLALTDTADELQTALRLAPEIAQRAAEHARAWSGTALEAEVHATAQGTPPSEAVLLVTLAALGQ